MDAQKHEVFLEISLIGGELLEIGGQPRDHVRRPGRVANARHEVALLERRPRADDRQEGRRARGTARGPGGSPRRARRRRRAGVGAAPISLSISGSPDDLETGLQLAYLLLTRAEDRGRGLRPVPDRHEAGARGGAAQPRVARHAPRGSRALPGRRRAAPAGHRGADRPADARRIAGVAREAPAESPIEVTIVGDLPRDRAIELAARYLGSLPARERVGSDSFRALRTVKRPEGPRRVERTLETPTEQAFVFSGFYGPDESNRPDVRAMNVAARVLSTRMYEEVREKSQLVYSIGAGRVPAGRTRASASSRRRRRPSRARRPRSRTGSRPSTRPSRRAGRPRRSWPSRRSSSPSSSASR